ncbi:uncharacterized protein PHALS_12849 [Plasmopara halstedii]|uniref:RxLR-like protein n=1 Tax=Plasmopara halstedii TaxID=4781 RepID=A0A0N7L5W2_PLAHL|nr:uncharacterized protein PHALS_12849 [Plasmopara halstedii]CEG42587.1 hypothetical protein PHALS_12849 [Plasmopara halstedii]|eukprot:XP_024578956.1 hypothetical protein PHALS_12849 [Plasmopara halstedii]
MIDSKLYFDFVRQAGSPDPATKPALMAMVKQSFGSNTAKNWEQVDPYTQVILYTSHFFKNNAIDEATRKLHIFGWIRYGFTRDEVLYILKFAGFTEPDKIRYMQLYDNYVLKSETMTLLGFQTLYINDYGQRDIRSANLVACKELIKELHKETLSVGLATSKNGDWEVLFDMWIKAGYERVKVENILARCIDRPFCV